MACRHCIAVISSPPGGPVTTTLLQALTGRLADLAGGRLQQLTDTASVTVWDATLHLPTTGQTVPLGPVPLPLVRVTVYKRFGRLRLQLLDHTIGHDPAHQLLGRLATDLGVRVETHSTSQDETLTRTTQAAHPG